MEQLKEECKNIKVYPIVAMSINGVIGKENKLPWPKCKEDLKRFRELTTDNVVIMGRKTYDSIGKPLPNRINIIVTSSIKVEVQSHSQDLHFTSSIKEALLLANSFDKKIFIIGGDTLYRQTLPLWDILYLTIINKHIEDGDTKFLNRGDWGKCIDLSHKDEEGYLNFLFTEIINGKLHIKINTNRTTDKQQLIFDQEEFLLSENKDYSFHTLKLIRENNETSGNE